MTEDKAKDERRVNGVSEDAHRRAKAIADGMFKRNKELLERKRQKPRQAASA